MIFKLDNIGKPQDKRWKFWSKFLTRSLPVYAGAVVALPDHMISPEWKAIIIFIQSIIVATISILSELTLDENIDADITP